MAQQHASAATPPPRASAARCPVCGSDEIITTKHPWKDRVVIVDCSACGQTSVTSITH